MDDREHRTLRDYESYADRLIREAVERGDFDDLPGAGRPLEGVGSGYDPEWWAKGFIRRERARSGADDVCRIVRAELPRLRASQDRSAAEARVDEINVMVAAVNEHLPGRDHLPRVEL